MTVLLAGQDITSTVNEPSIHWDSTLGQGAGVPGQLSGRATTAEFLTALGPSENALGSGQALPAFYTNLYSAAESDAESNTSVYMHGSSVTLSIDTAQVWQGNHSLKVVTSGGGNTFEDINCPLPVSTFLPGETYTFSVYLFTSGSGTLRIYCQADESKPLNHSIGTVTTYTLTTGAWTRYSVTVQMPNPIPYQFTIGLRLDTGSTPQALTFWLDGFQCELSSTAHTWIEGGQTVGTPHNLLSTNQASVMTDTAGFISENSATLSQDTTIFQQGSASLKVVTPGTVADEGFAALIPASNFSPNTTYTASVYLQGTGTLFLYWYGDTLGDLNNGTELRLTLTGTWTRYSITTTLPGTLSGNIGLRVDTRSIQADTFWADTMQLEPGNQATGWVSGGSTYPNKPSLVRQGELKIFDGTNAKVFGGYVTLMDDDTDKKQNYTDVQAHDYWQDLDRILVNTVYVNQSDTFIINDLITNYAPQISLSLVNLSAVNFTFQKLTLRSRTVLQALQKVADTTGFDIWVDVNKNLRYTNPTNLGTAAYAISDSPNFTTSFPAKITKYEQDDNAIISRVTFYGGKKPTPDFTQDISTQANGTNTTFTLAYYPRESSNGKIQVLVNSVQQVVGYANSSGPNNTLKSAGGNCDVLVNPDAQTLTFNVAPTGGQTVQAIYRYDTPLVVQLTNQPSFAFFGRWFDGSIADPSVTDTTTAIARCRIMLVEQAFGLLTIGLTTYQPGLVAGTQMRIDNGPRNIHNTYIIQEVHAKAQGNGFFLYDVVLGAWNWQLADILLAASRYYTPVDESANETNTPLQVEGLAQNVAVHDAIKVITHFASSWYYARAVPVGDGHDAFPGFFTVNSTLPKAACNNSSTGFGPGRFAGTANVIATGHVQ